MKELAQVIESEEIKRLKRQLRGKNKKIKELEGLIKDLTYRIRENQRIQRKNNRRAQIKIPSRQGAIK